MLLAELTMLCLELQQCLIEVSLWKQLNFCNERFLKCPMLL